MTLLPQHARPFRWLPRHGAPLSVSEWASQRIVAAVASAPVYVALIVAVIVAVQMFHPFGAGK